MLKYWLHSKLIGSCLLVGEYDIMTWNISNMYKCMSWLNLPKKCNFTFYWIIGEGDDQNNTIRYNNIYISCTVHAYYMSRLHIDRK